MVADQVQGSRIARFNILEPLARDVEKERRLIEAGEEFDQRHEETIERDRDELRRSGIVAADWKPSETVADHGYWDGWCERLRKVVRDLEAAGEPEIAGQLLTFCRQIDDRDEITNVSDFRFEKLAEWLAAAIAGDTATEDHPVPSRSISCIAPVAIAGEDACRAYDDEVNRAAKEDFHPSVDFLEPLSRTIESIIEFDIPPIEKLDALRMLFWDLTNAEVPIFMDSDPSWEIYRSDWRPAAWRRARQWLLAAQLTALCDDFTARTVRQREAIDILWSAVNPPPGRPLTADDFIDLELDDYLDTLQSLALTLRQCMPVTTTTQTPHGVAAGGAGGSVDDPQNAELAVQAAKVKRRAGRLPKAESEGKRMDMLARLRTHPSLKDEPAALANMVHVSAKTVRRWLDEEEAKYRESKAAQPDDGDDV
jgi:hypothetical protein